MNMDPAWKIYKFSFGFNLLTSDKNDIYANVKYIQRCNYNIVRITFTNKYV